LKKFDNTYKDKSKPLFTKEMINNATIEREETIQIHINLPMGCRISERIKEAIHKQLKVNFLPDCEAFQIHYKFDILYFGKIVEDFNLILKLCNKYPQYITQIKTKELRHGKSLAQELFVMLEQFERQFIKAKGKRQCR